MLSNQQKRLLGNGRKVKFFQAVNHGPAGLKPVNPLTKNGDLLGKLQFCIKLHGFEGPKKYFWHTAGILKLLILIGRTVYAIQSRHDKRKLPEMTATFPIRFTAVLKLFVLYFERDRVKYLLNVVKEDFWDSNIAGPKIEKRIRSRLLWTNRIVLFHFTASMIGLTTVIIFPLGEMPEGKRPLPNVIWTPFDTNPSPLHEILYVYLIWNLYLSLFGNAFYDVLYIYSLQHLCAQYLLLYGLLSNLGTGIMQGSTDLEKFNSEYFQSKVMERLKICVKHHNVLKCYGKILVQLQSKPLVAQLLSSYAALVINGYLLSTDHENAIRSFLIMEFSCSYFIQLSFFAIPATDLWKQSISVLPAVINSSWHQFRAPIKKSLTLLLLNAKSGISMYAGGVIIVDNPVLISVLKNVFSSITLLQAMIEGSL